jgi:PKD repeat protein
MTEIPVAFTSTVSGGKTPYTYEWNFGDAIISNEANPVHTFTNAGQYTVTLTVTDSNEVTKTTTKTITIQTTEGKSAEIKQVNGGFGVKATIAAGDNDCLWTINVDGRFVIFNGGASGTIQANKEVKVTLPFTLAFGKVDITVTANEIQKQYTAFALGPMFLKVQEI